MGRDTCSECTDDRWLFQVDRGGTFTDVVARDPRGHLHVAKVPSTSPEGRDDAILRGIRKVLDLPADADLTGAPIHRLDAGTTLATNALLEGRGARTGLLVTRGFADLLAIGEQDRPHLFALDIQKPRAPMDTVVELDERILADGTVRRSPGDAEIRRALDRLRGAGATSVAVVLLHAHAWPTHERQVGRLAREAGFEHVFLSHEVVGEIKAVARADTTVLDARITPLLRRWVQETRRHLPPGLPFRLMQSNGGLIPAHRFSGRDALLSGPAAGVVAMAHIGREAGHRRLVGFDMGGTSTDVSRFEGTLERVPARVMAGIRVHAPMLAVETIAAGGGSRLSWRDGRFQVGPESAGAHPGPAAYGRGGPAALTDANLVLGRIQPAFFPRCFGEDGRSALDPGPARQRLAALGARTDPPRSPEEAAAGFVRIANERMAAAIREISVSRGHDVTGYALVCFGGAGGQHACALADLLGMRTVLLHPLAGVLSALGMGMADEIHTGTRSLLRPLRGLDPAWLERFLAPMRAEGERALGVDAHPMPSLEHRAHLDLRYRGTDAWLTVDLDPWETLRERFERVHRRRYGYARPEAPVEAVNLRLDTVAPGRPPSLPLPAPARRPLSPTRRVRTWFGGAAKGGVPRPEPRDTPVFAWEALRPGHRLDGPALVAGSTSTVVVEPGWRGEVDPRGVLVLERARPAAIRHPRSTRADPVLLEVFQNLFASVAWQMGAMLERVAHSVNIKERRDFSCALFSPDGGLVANAPHIPVHLGAMSETVRAVRARRRRPKPGEVYVSNDPYLGGSHLPDVTVISPVFDTGDRLAFWVANRGHHADIGGIAPGSMPPFSVTLDEEGIVLRDELLVSGGELHEAQIRERLSAPPWPARDLEERLSDLRAQVAANRAGARLLAALEARHGGDVVHAYMDHVRANAAAVIRETIRALPDGEHRFEDRLDGGARLCCTVRIQGSRATVDFAGTDPQLPGNLNAPRGVVVAAVLYVFRTLAGRPIPLNQGCLEPIEIRIPPGSLLAPRPPAAVAGGNVETSQRIVDVLYGALDQLAASQGTMNNLTFGDAHHAYYETICGGAGAGPAFHGADAVHTHMTNTRITDPEVLETRYPVVVRRFSIRRGSGGRGRYGGGDGVVRELEFLAPLTVGMLSERRRTAPFGLAGGGDGAAGRNTLVSGEIERELPGAFQEQVEPGDVLRVETPGGGGYGNPAEDH